MAQVIVAQRMWQRRDTAANWTSKNPILEAGEIGVQLGATASDPQLFKIGNGVTNWNTLAFAGGAGAGAQWYTGSGAPSSGLGNNGDFYIRTSNGDLYQKATGTWSVIMNIKGPQGAPGDPGPTGEAGPPGPSSACFPTASFDGGDAGEDITVGTRTLLPIPFGFTITGATMVSFDIGTLVVDVRVKPYALHPPTALDSICGTSPPSILSDRKGKDTTLAGWTPEVPADSVMEFVVTACTGINKATLVLTGEREIP